MVSLYSRDSENMEDVNDRTIVFLPQGDGRALDSFSKAVLLQYSDSDVLVFRYGKRDGTEEDIVSLFGNGGRAAVRSLPPEGRDFMFELNDVLSMPQKTLTVDITFASPFHAAQANYFGLNSRLVVYYSFRTEAGPDRKQMNPHMKNYGKLDGDSVTLLTAMVNGCGTVMEMVVYEALVNLAPLLAVSLFIAVLMTLTRSWLDSEMVVWFSSGGISLLAWIRPVLRFSIPIIILITALSLVISPWAKGQSEMNREVWSQRDDVDRLSPGRFIEIAGGKQVFFVEEVSEDGLTVKNVFLTETDTNSEMVVIAKTGEVKTNESGDRYVLLHDGRRYEGVAGTPEYRVTEFQTYGVRLDVKPESAIQMNDVDTQPLPFLLMQSQDREAQGELLWRISWPIAALNLIMIAIPLSFTNPRAGRSLNMVVALLLFVLYLNGISVGRTWVEQGTMSLIPAIIVLNGVFTALAVILFLRRTILQRWIPVWMTIGYWRSRR